MLFTPPRFVRVVPAVLMFVACGVLTSDDSNGFSDLNSAEMATRLCRPGDDAPYDKQEEDLAYTLQQLKRAGDIFLGNLEVLHQMLESDTGWLNDAAEFTRAVPKMRRQATDIYKFMASGRLTSSFVGLGGAEVTLSGFERVKLEGLKIDGTKLSTRIAEKMMGLDEALDTLTPTNNADFLTNYSQMTAETREAALSTLGNVASFWGAKLREVRENCRNRRDLPGEIVGQPVSHGDEALSLQRDYEFLCVDELWDTGVFDTPRENCSAIHWGEPLQPCQWIDGCPSVGGCGTPFGSMSARGTFQDVDKRVLETWLPSAECQCGPDTIGSFNKRYLILTRCRVNPCHQNDAAQVVVKVGDRTVTVSCTE